MYRHLLPLLAILLAAVGCGRSKPGTYQVTGTVTWRGTPVETASIAFLPLNSTERADSTSAIDGRFSLRARPGRKKVQIFARVANLEQVDPAAGDALRKAPLPPPYNVQAVLETVIEPRDDNQLTFELSGTP